MMNQMTYDEWADTIGEHRWYHENGQPRTFLPLPDLYPELYAIVTQQADMAFTGRIIDNVDLFTREFLRTVPVAWNNFKVEFEMFTGTLDGSNIDPNVFEAGFTRDSTQKEKNTVKGSASSSANSSVNDSYGARTDTGDNKGRTITYEQGVQAYNETTTEDIGTHGNDYASGMVDSIAKTQNVTGAQINSQTANSGSVGNSSTDGSREFTEHIHETRINYYDNLAFMRDRFDRVQQFKPFEEYFMPCFAHIEAMNGDW